MVAELKQNRSFVNPAFLRAQLNRFGPLFGLLLVIAIFSILTGAPERYLAPKNLRTVLVQTVIVAIGSIGMTMIIVSGGIDLSVGSAIALCGVVTALGLKAGLSPVLAIMAGIVVGGRSEEHTS